MGRFTPEYRHSSCAWGFSHVQTFGGVYVLLLIALPSLAGATVDIARMSDGLRLSTHEPAYRCGRLVKQPRRSGCLRDVSDLRHQARTDRNSVAKARRGQF